ncbi:hypothetical protein EM6_1782 [Asticcacaulis excentricus]|uniref:Uncharacterized protein n=1 Tax=Asticcacaulis excentricus TaxID=78587 RepID=A0A3G9G3E5_9CAUL|nr:hypothetical protein EM6_1782 [Asticcacaulis excentricus]
MMKPAFRLRFGQSLFGLSDRAVINATYSLDTSLWPRSDREKITP